jgi:signal transduction histidine kinase
MVECATLDLACPPPTITAPSPPATYFAPAGRDSKCEFARKAALIEGIPLLKQAIDAMPSMVLILNDNRQIVTANQAFLAVKNGMIADVVEKRPGEAVGCIRSKEGPDGCGTARHCATCGAVNAILESQQDGKKVVRECRILVESADGIAAMDLRVTASPFMASDDRFIVAAIEDISQSKRLAVLQRTFFHDVLNTAGCIRGYADYLVLESAEDPETYQRIAELTARLIEAIQAERDLCHAEAGDLQLHPEVVYVPALLDALRLQYRRHPVAEGRAIVVGEVWEGAIVTDRQLLQRVLENMLKNALEATAAGNTVTIACAEQLDGVVFSVHNPEVMPPDVQMQLFQRSFSTKGESGRGIGTYSIKLLGERYLRGMVTFVSQEPCGTTFTLTLPETQR